MIKHSTARGESYRNSSRTLSRNSEPLDVLVQRVDGIYGATFYYQYCRNFHCSKITALIVSTTDNELNLSSNKPILVIAEKLTVPIIVVHHHTKDEDNALPIDIDIISNSSRIERKNITWREMLTALYDLQKDHEMTSSFNSKCGKARYEDRWLPTRKVHGNGVLDLSLSNALREIPGVGHLDVDAVICCEICSSVEALVEASSDGMRGTGYENRNKATRMTRKISRILGCYSVLLQHHPQDNEHQKHVMITGWYPSGQEFCQQVEISWSECYQKFASMHHQHCQRFHPNTEGNIC